MQQTRSSQSSPLPLEADLDTIRQMEDLLGDSVFSDKECNFVEGDEAAGVQQQLDLNFVTRNDVSTQAPLNMTISPQPSSTPSQNTGKSAGIEPPEAVLLKDHFLPSETLTPEMIINPPSTYSLHHSVDTPVLTPLFDDIPPPSVSCEMPQDQTASIDEISPTLPPCAVPEYPAPSIDDVYSSPPSNAEPEETTPMPSPLNRHRKCRDLFCPQHDKIISEVTQSPNINSNQASPTPLVRNRGRKRMRNYEEWGEVKRKRLTNEGKRYCSKRGRVIPEKEMRPACCCRYKCKDKISEENRKDIFKKFWALGDRAKQWIHIAKYTKKEHKKRTYFARPGKNNRTYTYKYFLPKIENQSHTTIEVCKVMFLNTLGITERMTRTAWKKYDGTTYFAKDMRGYHSNHKKVVDERMIASVCEHVKSFAPVESHYCRQTSTRLYLDGSLSISRMFNLYKEWLNENVHENPALTLRQYRDIVNSHFKLSFHVPKKDTCDQCHVFKNTENPSDELKSEYNNHKHNKTIARELKSKDKADAALSNGLIVCATFDLQKVLSCPHGQMSILYYKRKLSCYNLTVFDAASKEGFCYVWDETIAKRGANEISSCVYDFIKAFSEKGTKDFRFWSDNCAGQNKNRIIFAMYAFAAGKFGVKITHRFLERGHTQNEGDCVHSVIERASAQKTIYTPEEWKVLIGWAKTTDKPYQVRDVTQEDVFDFKELLGNKNWTKNSTGQSVAWSKIREVVIEDSNNIFYKYSLDDDAMTLVIGKKTRNRGDANIILKKAHSQPIPLSNEKFKDLKSLVESGIIPRRYQSFFQGLPHGRIEQEESDGDE